MRRSPATQVQVVQEKSDINTGCVVFWLGMLIKRKAQTVSWLVADWLTVLSTLFISTSVCFLVVVVHGSALKAHTLPLTLLCPYCTRLFIDEECSSSSRRHCHLSLDQTNCCCRGSSSSFIMPRRQSTNSDTYY